MKVELKHILSELGLNEVETKVFIANLELGPKGASTIAEAVGLNRITTYEALKRLSKKGLVKIRARKGSSIRYFEAEDIGVLTDKLEAKKQELQHTIDATKALAAEFNSLFVRAEVKPTVLFYEGQEGIKTVLKDTLKQKPQEILSFVSADFIEIGFGEEFLDAYWKERTNQRVPVRGIMPRTAKALSVFTPERNQQELRRLKFMSEDLFKFKDLFDIYGDNIAIMSLAQSNEHGIIIRSRSIAESMRALFEVVWVSL